MHFGLQAKISVFVASLIILIGIGQLSLTFYNERVSIWELRLTQIKNVITRTVALAEEPLYSFNVRELRNLISVTLHRDDLHFVWILDGDGRMVTDGTKANSLRNKVVDIGPQEKLFLINSDAMLERDGHFLFGSPITLPDGEVYGIVVLGIKTDVFNQPFKDAVANQIYIFLPALIFSIFAAMAFARRIIRPLKAVTRTAEQIGSGNWSKRVIYTAKDEIGELATSVNLMAENLMQIAVSRDELVEAQNRIERESAKQVSLMEDLSVARDQAEAASKSKSEFLATMSHEIRTPMTGVIGMAELILNSDLSPKQLDWANHIKTSGDHLLVILNEILDQSKLEADKLELASIDFHIASMIYDTTELFAPMIEKQGLKLNITLDDGLPDDAHADRLRIGQILSNLLSNSIKFTQTGSIDVRVSYRPLNNDSFKLKIQIKDTGIGISEKAMANLFSAFTQADSSTSRQYGGTGLGLSISKQLTELLGGEIGVKSVEGEGSTFWFTSLCHTSKGQVEVSDRRHSLDRWQASRSLKVLVAEDDFVNQLLIKEIMNNLNHEVTIAENGKIATELISTDDFDFVLMDIRMPVMDGMAATRIIRSFDTEISNIPIIALTADISAGNIDDYLSAGIDMVCGKPLELPVILKAVNKLLDEEIHTSFAGAYTPAPEPQNTKEDAVKTIAFEEVLERVAAIVDQTSGQNKDIEIPAAMALIGEDAFEKLLIMYEDGLAEQCDKFTKAISDLSINPTDNGVKTTAKELVHSIKGGGGSFGYNLISTIARNADKILKDTDDFTQEVIEVLSNHAKALELVSTKKMSGNGGKPGQILLHGLDDKD